MTIYKQIYEDFRKGHIDSFYETMYPELLVYVTRLLGDDFSFLAEDCVQDAVLNTYSQRHQLPTPLQWKVYLYTCARNKALGILRKGHAHGNYISDQGKEKADIVLDIIEQETLTLLYNAIDSLPEQYRQLFDLSFEQGLKNAQVASLLGMAEITIKKRKARLISLLREKLGDELGGILLPLLTI